jgi:hypothetical protein
VHQGDVSVYLRNVDLISLRQSYTCMEHDDDDDDDDYNNNNTERTDVV